MTRRLERRAVLIGVWGGLFFGVIIGVFFGLLFAAIDRLFI